MSVLVKILPIILAGFIFYFLAYNVYPSYREVISLTQKLNELNLKLEEIKSIENLLKNLNNNPNIQVLIKSKDTLEAWVPSSPKIEEIAYSLSGIYSSNGLVLSGFNFSIEKVATSTQNYIPLNKINITLDAKGGEDQFLNIIDSIEKNIRLMSIKRVNLSKEKMGLEVESYFLPKQ